MSNANMDNTEYNKMNEMITSHFYRIGEVIAAAEAEAVVAATAADLMDIGAGNHVQEHLQRQPTSKLTEIHLYKIEDIFSEKDLYWQNYVRGSRFESSFNNGILYRPQIVNDLADLVEKVLNQKVREGIMVKGPQGIGKSHSLVNLVRKLLYDSNNKYLVTFIPDCEKFNTAYDLLFAICASFGATPATAFGINERRKITKDVLMMYIKLVDASLAACKKQWIFIFDQINNLFVKPGNREALDASYLKFPHYMIDSVLFPGRITSIISASANNEMPYKERFEGFVQYIHEYTMSEQEVIIAFSSYARAGDAIAQLTGNVPLYVAQYLESGDTDEYEREVESSVQYSLETLRNRDREVWKLIQKATFACLLKEPTEVIDYDKNFFTQKKVPRFRYEYEPLVPQVLTATRKLLWDSLMDYVAEEEAKLLAVCKNLTTLNSTRGQHFEYMVIQRCVKLGVNATIGNIKISLGPKTTRGFSGRALPSMDLDGIYYPFETTFPAIDLVLKQGCSIFGVQIHVNAHDDVSASFAGMCRTAGFFQPGSNYNIYLVYLSPEEQVKNMVEKLVNPAEFDVCVTGSNSSKCIIRRCAISIDAVLCLKDLQWPAGCSTVSQ